MLAEVYSAVPEEAALTAVLSNAASMVSLMLFIFLLQGRAVCREEDQEAKM